MRINETAALMLILGSFCPLTLFVLFWWIAGGIANYSRLPISDTAVAISAFAGLLLGIVLDVLCLRTWTAGFYDCGMAVLLALYLLMTAMSTALCMGLPCGNLVLGSGAGLYVGRRWRHAGRNRRDFAWAARGVCVLTALVTGLTALPFGLLALSEPGVVGGVTMIVVACLLLMPVQGGCTYAAAGYAFRGGAGSSPS